MSNRGIAIGGVALTLAVACGAVIWVRATPATEEMMSEGVLLSRTALDQIVASVKEAEFVCPYAVHGELMDASDIGKVYRVSCASQRKEQPPAQFRITVRPYADPSVERW